MGFSKDDRQLGMDRAIPRRDFLNGVAVAIAAPGALGIAATPLWAQVGADQASNYPPLRTGLRGNTAAALESFPSLQEGRYAEFPVAKGDIKEEYDLVIVGAGISGLAAAHFHRKALGKDQRILILDNHDDFGGHAKRNEFHHDGRTYIGFGGTMGIATPYPYSYGAKRLIEELGIDVPKSSSFLNHELETKYALKNATFFDKEHFSEDKLVTGNPRQRIFFGNVPLSAAACADLTRIHGKNPDYMAGTSAEEKKVKLAKMSWQDFLLRYAKVSPEAINFFLGVGGRNNKRIDTTPALEAAERGSAGFNGLGLEFPAGFNEGSYVFHFPDGNASVARLLVSRLIPESCGGEQTMNTIVQTKLRYDVLDKADAPMRIRLSSTAVRVKHDGDPEKSNWVNVAYRRDGKVEAVRGRQCILACYNRLIPSLMPEIPAQQKTALAYPVKVPMLYTNVLLRQWTAFQKLGISRVSAPGMYHTSVSLDPGSTVGGYSGVTTPEEPIVVHMVRNPNKPGLPRKEQNRAGQQELLSMSFRDFEMSIRAQLARIAGPGGFDPAKDILAITVNRWPYGYAYTYDTLADPDVPQEQRPHILGRARFGSVAIANSDAGAGAFTNQAIDEANRAVEELLVKQGLT